MLPLLFRAYIAVFGAEIVGDKLLYTTGVLATRYRTTPIVIAESDTLKTGKKWKLMKSVTVP